MRCTMFSEASIRYGNVDEWYRWECGCSYVTMSPVRSTVRYFAKQHLEGAVSQAALFYANRLDDLRAQAAAESGRVLRSV